MPPKQPTSGSASSGAPTAQLPFKLALESGNRQQEEMEEQKFFEPTFDDRADEDSELGMSPVANSTNES